MTTYNVWVGDIQFDWKYADRGYFYKNLAGWNDLADVRGKRDAVPSAHGLYPAVESWRTGASITVTGSLMGASRADAEYLRDQLITALSSASVMRVEDSTGTWLRDVEVDEVSIKDPGGWSPIIHFKIDLVAPDPVRYSDVLPFGPVGLPVLEGGLFLPASLPWDLGVADLQVAEVTNAGSLPMHPVVTLQGSASSVVVHGGPRVLSFGAFDGTLVFDSLQRRAFLNGADVTRLLVQRDWFVIPPGGTLGFSFEAVAPSPGLYMSGEYRIGVW